MDLRLFHERALTNEDGHTVRFFCFYIMIFPQSCFQKHVFELVAGSGEFDGTGADLRICIDRSLDLLGGEEGILMGGEDREPKSR